MRYVSTNPRQPDDPATARWYDIVGVVENIDGNPFGRDLVDPRVYHAMKIGEETRAAVAVRVAGVDHGSLARRVARIAVGIDRR